MVLRTAARISAAFALATGSDHDGGGVVDGQQRTVENHAVLPTGETNRGLVDGLVAEHQPAEILCGTIEPGLNVGDQLPPNADIEKVRALNDAAGR